MNKKESAVSPVIAVMLMLVVTIIIAAVVSGFAGGLANSNSAKAPSMSMDVKIVNTGTWIGSGIFATVTGVSEPIRTKDLKITTQWKSRSGVSGGNTTVGNTPNVNMNVGMGKGLLTNIKAPIGFGPGINGTSDSMSGIFLEKQWFGNYTLVAGTSMSAVPYGTQSGKAIGGAKGSSDTGGYGNGATAGTSTPYTYTIGGSWVDSYTDPTMAVLGKGWENLTAGDTVQFSVIHIPSGKTIFDRPVVVTEG